MGAIPGANDYQKYIPNNKTFMDFAETVLFTDALAEAVFASKNGTRGHVQEAPTHGKGAHGILMKAMLSRP